MEISIELFKTQHIKLIDDIQKNQKEIIITKLGKPIAKLIPVFEKPSHVSPFGYMKNTVSIHEDIIAPTGEKWEVE